MTTFTAAQHEAVRRAVAAKVAYWDALRDLENALGIEPTIKQDEAMTSAIEYLAGAADVSATDTSKLDDNDTGEVLTLITTS